MHLRLCLILTAMFTSTAYAQSNTLAQGLLTCNQPNDAERLACFDQLAKQLAKPTDEPATMDTLTEEEKLAQQPSKRQTSKVTQSAKAEEDLTYLERKWHLNTQGRIQENGSLSLGPLQPHRQNYVVSSFSSDTNDVVQSPSQSASNNRDLQSADLHFQLSLKTPIWHEMSLIEDNFSSWIDTSRIWFGYTQRSYWQIFDGDKSRPFRETNFSPEFIWSLGLKKRYAWMPRMVNLAVMHESNGREDPYSRSWNRLYLETGWQFGEQFTLIARPWWDLPEGGLSDNPDIEKFLGYGDLTVRWESQDKINPSKNLPKKSASLMFRNNLRGDNKSYAKFDYQYALSDYLKWYVMFSTGYGESLLDYNHHQNLLGFGFAVGE